MSYDSTKLAKNKAGTFILAWELQVWLLLGSRAVQTIMRMALGPLLVYLCSELSCTASSKGEALSAFSLGYFSTQILGGVLGDYAGARTIIGISHVVAGLVMAFTPEFVDAAGLAGLWTATVCMGVLQGPLFPASMSYLSKWLPAAERSWASSMLDSGITIGSFVVMPLSGKIAFAMGWRSAFRLYGVVSIIFAAVWQRRSANCPAECKFILAEELAMLKEKTAFAMEDNADCHKTAATERLEQEGFIATSVQLLCKVQVWAVFLSHAAFNFGVYFQTSWTPMYYQEKMNVTPEHASLDLTLPAILNLVVKAGIAKRLFVWLHETRGFSLITCRRCFSVVGFLGAAFAYAALALLGNQEQSRMYVTAFFTLAMGLVGLHPSGFKANYMDLSVRSSGLISGLGNTIASISSFIGPLAVGALLAKQQSWPLVFATVASVNVIAAIIFGTLSSTEPVDASPSDARKRA